MAFPKNNLPVDSLLWGREVERRVDNLETSLTSSQINNSSRDAQLLSNFQRLDVAVADLVVTTTTANDAATAALSAAATAQTAADDAATAAQTALDAIDGLTSLGSTGSTYSINADNITAGTINASNISVTNLSASNITSGTLTGRNVRTASSGERVQLTGSENAIQFFNSSGSVAVNMFPGTPSGGTSGLFVSYSSVPDTTADNFLCLENNEFTLHAGSANGSTVAGSAGGLTLSTTGSGNVLSIDGPQVDVTAGGPLNLNAGNTTATGIYLNNYTYYPPGASIASATVSAIGIDVNNLIRRSSSSIRYKTEVQPISLDYQKWIEMPLVTYKYKQDIEDLGNRAPVLNGYIAEELHELGHTDLVLYEKDENGNFIPEGVNTNSLAAGTHAAVQHQAKIINGLVARIEALEARLSELENRV